jgi:hypothetical protein
MNERQIRLLSVAVSVALALPSGRAAAVVPEHQSEVAVERVGFVLLGGLALPVCRNQQGCGGDLGGGPSLAGFVLLAPNERWAFGLGGQVSRVHWGEAFLAMSDGSPQRIDLDLTTGFAGVAARYTVLPERRVTPVVHAALGTGLQMQTGTNYHCNDGFIPTGQLAVGARMQTDASLSFLGLASATWGFKEDCGVSDGPGATPFAGWGFGLHLGAAFDLLL